MPTLDDPKTRDYRRWNFKDSGYSSSYRDEGYPYSNKILVPDPSELIHAQYRGIETKWQVICIITERQSAGEYYPEEDAFVTEAVATGLVTQVDGPEVGRRAFMKLWQQIANDNVTPNKPCLIGPVSRHELEMLMTCTTLHMKATPQLLGFARVTQRAQDTYPGGFRLYTIMEELPGKDVAHFADLPLEERDEVRLAAAKAMREVNSFSLRHNEPLKRHLIWGNEQKRCWLVGLEALVLDRQDRPLFWPCKDWESWDIHRTCLHPRDSWAPEPTIEPLLDPFVKDPDDEYLKRTMQRAWRNRPPSPSLLWMRGSDERHTKLFYAAQRLY
ncbi:hypothetical protein KEM56_001652 [Ascosphaera pollenicola]|nr:hypothetical protein KEM56_001652 [Ascosphaera pollenicola]